VSGALALLLCACQQQPVDDGRPETARDFPVADRPVSKPGQTSFATEVQRDSVNEASVVMDLARIEEGMSVADIGAGEGYYTVRLAERVGAKGRVLAEEIDPAMIEQLGTRVMREGLENVSIKLGTEDDPSLPPDSFDRVFLVHMYHEVTEPYAHGIPPALLFCEFASVGFRLTEFVRKPELQGYYAQFEAAGVRPSPENITPCRVSHDTQADLH
jgi:SAM-dependent methyltransferase